MFDWKNVKSAVPPEVGVMVGMVQSEQMIPNPAESPVRLSVNALYRDIKRDDECDKKATELIDGIKDFEDKTNYAAIYALINLAPSYEPKSNGVVLMKRIVQVVNSVYEPQTTMLTPTEGKLIYDLFPCLTGRKKRELKALKDEEEAVDYLLKNTTFFSQCFTKQSALIMDVALNFWKKYDGNFGAFIKKKDSYLNKVFPTERGEKVERRGIDHLLGNTLFGARVMDIIPASQWNNHVMLSLFIRSLNRETPLSYMESMIKCLETIPSSKEKTTRGNLLFGFLLDNYRENHEVLAADSSVGHFAHLLRCCQSKELKSELARFLHGAPTEFVDQVVQELKTDNDYKAFVELITTNAKGAEEILDFKTKSGENVIWHLHQQGKINPVLLERLIETAIRTQNTDFLMAPKKGELNINLPGYQSIRGYFVDMPMQALKFIDTFQGEKADKERTFQIIQDFIPSKAIQKKLVYRQRLLNQWMKKKSYRHVLQFCFGIEEDTTAPVESKLSKEDMNLLWQAVDESGKTPWHYLCEQKEKLFFKRNFQGLYDSFLKVAHQADHSGKSPLDYANGNLKFMQYIADKIPAVTGLLSGTNYTLEYQAPEKVKEEKAPVIEVKQEASVPVAAPQEKWKIAYYGGDSERKNPEYIRMIEEVVEDLPPPKSSAMREIINRNKKMGTYNASVLKAEWNGNSWRIPFIVYNTTIFILTGIARKEAYKPQHAQLIRGLVSQLEKDLKSPIFIAHHVDKEPEADKINQKN